jgi:hypothetical protein
VRSFGIDERRARLARRHHLAPAHRASDVVDAADGVVVLHATDPATVHLAVWARVDDVTVEDVDAALYDDRTLVKHLCMRRTLFAVPRHLLGATIAGASHRVADQQRRQLAKQVAKEGLVDDGDAWLRDAEAATLAELGRRGEATATELRAAVELLQMSWEYAPHKAYGGRIEVAPRVMTCLSAAGLVLRAGNQGRWTVSRPTWAPTAEWLGAAPDVPAEREARAELVRRWLARFGPATRDDLKWWLGSTVSAVRSALDDVGAVEVDLHGEPGVALPDDLDPVEAPEPWAALLPGLDPTTMGWYHRDWYLGSHRPQIFDRNGNGGTTAWWDGRIVGGWTQTATGAVVLQVLEDVGAEATAALEAEADRLEAWLDGTRVSQRFPSPLTRAAAAG